MIAFRLKLFHTEELVLLLLFETSSNLRFCWKTEPRTHHPILWEKSVFCPMLPWLQVTGYGNESALANAWSFSTWFPHGRKEQQKHAHCWDVCVSKEYSYICPHLIILSEEHNNTYSL